VNPLYWNQETPRKEAKSLMQRSVTTTLKATNQREKNVFVQPGKMLTKQGFDF